MVFFNCSKKPPCNCFQPCSITSCNASLPLSDAMGCLLSARLGRAVGRHPLSFYPHFQQKILQTGVPCRRKMRMSGLCKVEMSAFLRAGGPYGRGADRVECEGAGAVEGVARD